MEYSVAVTNKYMLALDEHEDPLELLNRNELVKEAKRKEKLLEKSKHEKEPKPAAAQQQPASNKKASRTNKENQQQQQQQSAQSSQQPKSQDAKKEQGDKKPAQQKSGGDRNVKFATENSEEHNNRRNRENGEQKPPRIQNEFKRGPPGDREQRGGDYPYQGTREYRNSNITTTGAQEGERRQRGAPRGSGGGSSFRGGRGRGGRGGFENRGGFDNRGKREYDRQSGSDKTGVKPVDKKDGAGNHNWGNHNDEIQDVLNQQSEEWPVTSVDAETSSNPANDSTGSANVSGGEGTAPATEKPAEETRELTLDEWKALRETNRVKPTYNLRKAGEGEDLSRWKKMYALERKKENADDEDEEEEEYDAAEYPQRVGRQKHVLDIEINFTDSRRSAGGRGGRGGRGGYRMNGRGFGNRGSGNRGEYVNNSTDQRSPRERQNAPKVDDEHDFPSLG